MLHEREQEGEGHAEEENARDGDLGRQGAVEVVALCRSVEVMAEEASLGFTDAPVAHAAVEFLEVVTVLAFCHHTCIDERDTRNRSQKANERERGTKKHH